MRPWRFTPEQPYLQTREGGREGSHAGGWVPEGDASSAPGGIRCSGTGVGAGRRCQLSARRHPVQRVWGGTRREMPPPQGRCRPGSHQPATLAPGLPHLSGAPLTGSWPHEPHHARSATSASPTHGQLATAMEMRKLGLPAAMAAARSSDTTATSPARSLGLPPRSAWTGYSLQAGRWVEWVGGGRVSGWVGRDNQGRQSALGSLGTLNPKT